MAKNQAPVETQEEDTFLAEDGTILFHKMNLPQLKKYCALFRLPVPNEATKEDLVELLKQRAQVKEMAVVAETSNRPAPGWCRIEVNRDPTPGHSNRPIYVAINGYRITIPRGTPVDVPIKIRDVLNDAREYKLVENQDEPLNSTRRYMRQAVLSYPFQVLDINPGPDPRPGYEQAKQAQYGPRKQFYDMFRRWPKRHELIEAQKEGLIKLTGL